MSAPPNDLWANAQVLSLTPGGGVSGTNIDATAETGEPANNGFTVWYKWPSGGPVVGSMAAFGTIYSSALGVATDPILMSVVQVFTGSAVNALTEVAYLSPSSKSRFGGWDFGSQVIFEPAFGTDYYIRVDGNLVNTITSVSSVNGGSGYAMDDTVTTSGGDVVTAPVFTVTSVDGDGAITGLAISVGGYFASNPPGTGFADNKLTTITGDGSGAIFNLGFSQVGHQGNFNLFWGLYYPVDNMGCSSCAADDPTYICQGALRPPVTTGFSSDFGTFPAGKYRMKYCGGAFIFGAGPQWTVYLSKTPYLGVNFLYYSFKYYLSSVQTEVSMGTLFGVSDSDYLDRIFDNETAALLYFLGLPCEYFFDHSGGAITLIFDDSNYPDNAEGNPSPIWGLYLVVPKFIPDGACAGWTTPGSVGNVTFTIQNLGNVAWTSANDITVTLLSTGGISSPSSPITSFAIGANTTATAAFTFDCSTSSVVGTLQFSSPQFATFTMDFNLAPILVIGSQTLGTASTVCSGKTLYPVEFATPGIKNIGAWGLNEASVTVTATNGILLLKGQSTFPFINCTDETSLTLGTINLNGCPPRSDGGINPSIYLKSPSVATDTVVTIVIQDSVDTIATINFPTTVS